MLELSVIETQRLRLHPIAPSDASFIQESASAREISDTMISLTYPYPAGEAVRYIARQQAELLSGHSATYTIRKNETGFFCGLIELRDIDREHWQAELSFWLDVKVWGRGYMSEVVQAVVQYGFDTLGLNRLYAYHVLRNPASARVLVNNGFKQEGGVAATSDEMGTIRGCCAESHFTGRVATISLKSQLFCILGFRLHDEPVD